MAITVTNKAASATDTPGTSFSLTSVAYQNNALYLVSISMRIQTATISAITGGGFTWTQLTGSPQNQTNSIFYVFRGLQTSGASTASLAVTCSTSTAAHWCIDEFTGVDTSGTNGSGAIVQSAGATGSSASLSVTLSAFADATNNVAYGAFGHSGETVNIVADASGGFTITNVNTVTTPAHSHASEWKTGQDTGVSASWATAAQSGGVAAEVKMAAATDNPRKPFLPARPRAYNRPTGPQIGWR